MTTIPCDQPGRPRLAAPPARVRRTSRLAGLSRRRILALAFTGCALILVPWVIGLGLVLPATAEAPHWNIAWAGLDTLEAAGLFATGRLLARGDRRYAVTSALTGTALLIDAWFDMLTSATRGELLTSVAMAVLVELPLAGFCLVLAFRTAGPRNTDRDLPVRAPSGPGGGTL